METTSEDYQAFASFFAKMATGSDLVQAGKIYPKAHVQFQAGGPAPFYLMIAKSPFGILLQLADGQQHEQEFYPWSSIFKLFA